jgi:multidrug resistance efflux pump
MRSSEEKVATSAPPELEADLASKNTEAGQSPWLGSGLKVAAIGVLFLIAIIGAVLVVSHKSDANRGQGHTAVAKQLPVRNLRLKGTTEAIQSRAMLVPILSGQQVASLTITRLAQAGSRVKRGDLLVEFDRQTQIRDALDKQAEYNKFAGQVTEEQAKEDAARAKDETELHLAESDLKGAELDMKKVELMSRIDAEKAQENLEQAKATLKQLKETFELKRSAAHAAIRILEIQRDRTRRNMENAQSNAALMQIRSPLDGVVVLNTIWKNGRMGEAQEGDQVRPGIPFMRVVDPSAMQVQVLVNQEDVLGLRIGDPATVRLDAYPEFVVSGKLEQIAPVGREGGFSGKVRTFSAVFSIQGSDPRLMPDLSAAVDILPEASRTVASTQTSSKTSSSK